MCWIVKKTVRFLSSVTRTKNRERELRLQKLLRCNLSKSPTIMNTRSKKIEQTMQLSQLTFKASRKALCIQSDLPFIDITPSNIWHSTKQGPQYRSILLHKPTVMAARYWTLVLRTAVQVLLDLLCLFSYSNGMTKFLSLLFNNKWLHKSQQWPVTTKVSICDCINHAFIEIFGNNN